MAVLTSIYQAANSTLALLKTYLGGATSDSFLNEETVHDTQRDVDADVFNRILAGLGENALRTRPGNLIVQPFSIQSLTSGQTDLRLTKVSDAVDPGAVHWIAWRGASIVGATVKLQNNVSAGGANACVVEVRSATPPAAMAKLTNLPQLILDDTTTVRRNRVNQLPGVDTVLGLDEVDVVVTTDAAFAAGATPTLWVDVYISIGEEEAL